MELPTKEPEFVVEALRCLFEDQFATEFGADAFSLLAYVLMHEAAFVTPASLNPMDLMARTGIRSTTSLHRVRALCVESGWLQYTPGDRAHSGKYSVCIPDEASRCDFDWRRSGPERVYFLHCVSTRLVKIGKSRDVNARVSTLQTGSPTPLVLLGTISTELHTEAALHGRFSHLRQQGEWFLAAPELLEFIQSVVN